MTGGVSGIFGIRNAGLAISVGSWSAITVLISFLWGMVVFHEKVESVVKTSAGIVLMFFGFSGMTYFSPPKMSTSEESESLLVENNSGEVGVDNNLSPMKIDGIDTLRESLEEGSGDQVHSIQEASQGDNEMDDDQINDKQIDIESSDAETRNLADHKNDGDKIMFLGIFWNRRLLGILGASLDGILGGSNLVPMHYANAGGLEYVISFSIGAAFVTVLGWVLRFLYNFYATGSAKGGWNTLPSMYFKELWVQGTIAGLLWSVGNIGQILSVSLLGESIGMSIVQSQMIVSGIWGILWFGDMKGTKPILGWATSALLATMTRVLVASKQLIKQRHTIINYHTDSIPN